MALAGAASNGALADAGPGGPAHGPAPQRAIAELDQVLFHPADRQIEPTGLAELDRSLAEAQKRYAPQMILPAETA